MNIKHKKGYLNTVVPEVRKAISDKYPDDRKFINTKHLMLRITENAGEYPVLSARPQKHILDALTCTMGHILKFKQVQQPGPPERRSDLHPPVTSLFINSAS